MKRFVHLVIIILSFAPVLINAQTLYNGNSYILYLRDEDDPEPSYPRFDTSVVGSADLVSAAKEGTSKYIDLTRPGIPDSVSITVADSVDIFGKLYFTSIIRRLPFKFVTGYKYLDTTDQNTVFNNIYILRNDKDSIIFTFRFTTTHVEKRQDRAFHWVLVYDSYIGIARISTETAGVSARVLSASAFSCFPNPTSGQLHLQTSLNSPSSLVSIVDQTGRKVMTQQLSGFLGGDIDLNVSSLVSGAYMICVSDGEKREMGRFIKY
jgi:hypothetical protein